MKLFTVGPVEMYEHTIQIGGKQTPYFRNHFFSNVMYELDNNLKEILNMKNEDKNIVLTASGTGAMDATVINCLNKEDKVLVISGGSFGQRFEELCRIYSVAYDAIHIPYGMAFCEDMLEKYEGKGYTTLLVNIHETSTGQLYPIEILSDFCVRNNLYFIVDGISSLFTDDINFHEQAIDALIYSSQKAMALPPGISVVSLSERMCKKINPKPQTLYFDFNLYLKDGTRGQTPFTPAVGIILQMNEMIRRIKEEGIENKVAKTKELAEDFRYKLINAGFEIPKYPLSNALTPILFEQGAKYYYDKLVSDYEITVNPCGGALSNKMLRVGHMGNLSVEDNDMLIKALCEIRNNIRKNSKNIEIS